MHLILEVGPKKQESGCCCRKGRCQNTVTNDSAPCEFDKQDGPSSDQFAVPFPLVVEMLEVSRRCPVAIGDLLPEAESQAMRRQVDHLRGSVRGPNEHAVLFATSRSLDDFPDSPRHFVVALDFE